MRPSQSIRFSLLAHYRRKVAHHCFRPWLYEYYECTIITQTLRDSIIHKMVTQKCSAACDKFMIINYKKVWPQRVKVENSEGPLDMLWYNILIWLHFSLRYLRISCKLLETSFFSFLTLLHLLKLLFTW